MRALPLLAVLLLAGCSTPAEDAAEVLERSVQLTPRGTRGSAVEVNLNMTEGALVTWRFDASSPLAWDVHTHNGREVETLAEGNDAAASGEFRAPRAGVYSLYLQNRNASATVDASYRVEGSFQPAP